MPDLNGARFALISNMAGDAVAGETIFAIEQNGQGIRVMNEGGGVAQGAMIGKWLGESVIGVSFIQLTADGRIVGGEAVLQVVANAEGFGIVDDWRFVSGAVGAGRAIWQQLL